MLKSQSFPLQITFFIQEMSCSALSAGQQVHAASQCLVENYERQASKGDEIKSKLIQFVNYGMILGNISQMIRQIMVFQSMNNYLIGVFLILDKLC